MNTFTSLFKRNQDNSPGDADKEPVQYSNFRCRCCFEVYHLIHFLAEINQMEHAMLLTEDDPKSEPNVL